MRKSYIELLVDTGVLKRGSYVQRRRKGQGKPCPFLYTRPCSALERDEDQFARLAVGDDE